MPQIRKKALPVRFPRNTCSHIFFSLGKPSLSFQFLHSILSEYFPGSQRRSCTEDSRQTLGRLLLRLAGYAVRTICRVRRALGGLREVCFRHGLSSGGNLHPRFPGHTDFEPLLWQHADRRLFTSTLQHTLLLAFSHSHGHSRYRHLKNIPSCNHLIIFQIASSSKGNGPLHSYAEWASNLHSFRAVL